MSDTIGVLAAAFMAGWFLGRLDWPRARLRLIRRRCRFTGVVGSSDGNWCTRPRGHFGAHRVHIGEFVLNSRRWPGGEGWL